MKQWTMVLATLLALGFAGKGFAHEGMGGMDDDAAATAKPMTMTGEILDMACFMSSAEQGSEHSDCALKCAKEGSPLGFLTGGKAYFLVNDHKKEKAFQAAKALAGQKVDLVGKMVTQAGATAIVVESVSAPGSKPAKVSSAKKWRCPMDGYEADGPGKCPKCGMDLVQEDDDTPATGKM